MSLRAIICHCERQRSNLSRGFTLIELLVAVAILVLVLGAAVSVEVNSIRLADRNQHYLQATNLAQEKINLVKTVRDNNPTNDPFAGFPTVFTEIYQIVMPGVTFSPVNLATDPNGQKVTIGEVDYYVKINITTLPDITP